MHYLDNILTCNYLPDYCRIAEHVLHVLKWSWNWIRWMKSGLILFGYHSWTGNCAPFILHATLASFCLGINNAPHPNSLCFPCSLLLFPLQTICCWLWRNYMYVYMSLKFKPLRKIRLKKKHFFPLYIEYIVLTLPTLRNFCKKLAYVDQIKSDNDQIDQNHAFAGTLMRGYRDKTINNSYMKKRNRFIWHEHN